MDSFQSTKACHDKDGPVDITLWESTEDSRPNCNCHDSNPSISVVCEDNPLGNCCMGDENKLFDSVKSNQADEETSSVLYARSGDDPCRQIITSSSSRDEPCLAGSSAGMSLTGAVLEGPEDKSIGDIPGPAENSEVVVPKRRVWRPNLYGYRDANRNMYYIPVISPLGDEYRKLATKREKMEFMAKHGMSREDAREAKRQLAQE
ncbi:hypothetical protein X797_009699 [Metarhizium robertsii]|uniref:Uncharacterized protein n=2 Tax=Metarhizium robertsii TaxID=568076 RepID=E9F8P9_METRA|nr:uncharacterized protein MAA_08648 [Metarhizium robertsii ARSEF 23]EFY95840.1 hypothetical protein MAA_08648 [Metarhizium robertsii ARSEF 23]EXU97246.1 hypothetical protein X797_009699 [Metarhizium robertsii]